LRSTNVCLDLELALHAVNQNVEVQLTHTADDGLAGLLVQLHGEGRVLFRQLLDGGTQLLLVGLGLRLDGHLDDRIREVHVLEDDRVSGVGQGVTGCGVLQADECVDVTSGCAVNRLLLVGVHLEQLADALRLVLGGVDDLVAGLHRTGVDADVGQLAEERVNGDLERQSGERLVAGRLAVALNLAVLRVKALDRADVYRVRQVVDDGVQDRLDALVLVGGTTEDRVCLAVDGEVTDLLLDLVDGDLLAGEVALHELFIGLRDSLDELLAVLLSLLLQVGRDLLDGRLGACSNDAWPHQSLHLQQADNTLEVVLSADRQLHDQRLRTETVNDGLHGVVKVRTQLVHLVDEADARDVVLIRLAPDLLRLRLNAFLRAEDSDSAVQDTQGTLDLTGEVDVARGIDQVDLVVVPEAGRRGGSNRDAALLLLLHPVHGGCAVVGLAHLTVDTGVEEDAFGGGGLTGIDVGHDADVADLLQVGQCFECHWLKTPLNRCRAARTLRLLVA